MKNLFNLKAMLRIAGIIALAAVVGFSAIACGGGGGGGGGGARPGTQTATRDPATFTGTTTGGESYTLKIEAGSGASANVLTYDAGFSRAVLTPANGDRYTLTNGSGASARTSRGTITVNGTTYTLSPTEFPDDITVEVADFTVNVSGTSIIAMSGVVTWTNGEQTQTVSFTFIPPSSSNQGLTIVGIPARYNGKGTYFTAITDDDYDDGNFTVLLGIKNIQLQGNTARYILSPIQGGSVTIPILYSATGTAGATGYQNWTGSGTFDTVMVLILPALSFTPEELSGIIYDYDALENGEIDVWDFEDVTFTGGRATVVWNSDVSTWDDDD